MIRRILVGVDRSPRAQDVLATALTLASRLDATIVPVVAVADDLPRGVDGEALLADAKRTLRASMPGETSVPIAPPFVRLGSPWRVILDAAKAFETDAIVVGSGSGEALGSTACRVVQLGDRTVFVVRQPVRPVGKGSILAALDTSEQALSVFETTAWLAHRLGAAVHPVRAIELGGWGPSEDDAAELRLVNMIVNELLAIAAQSRVTTLCAPIVRHGQSWSVILAAAEEVDADIVTLGGWSNERPDVMGRNAARAVELLRTNVMIVRPRPSKSSIPPS